MFVITLLCDPLHPRLDAALVEALRNAWGGGDALWLAPDEAAEFTVAQVPSNRWQVWEDLQNQGVDLIVGSAENRKKQILIADMDSTLIKQECVDELGEEAGVGAKVAEITKRAMNGEIEFEAAMAERVGLLKGLNLSVITKVLNQRITYTGGGRTLVSTMKAAGAYTAVVSGGFTDFTGPVADHLGMDEHRANVLLKDGDHLTGDVAKPILGRESKVEALNDLTAAKGLGPKDVIAVGDGANDLGMLGLAGMGVALHAKPSVAAQCDIRINHGDLTALLYLQGYRKDEFIS